MAPPLTVERPVTLGKNFRLPLEVKPTRYRADLRIDLDGARFDGRLAIDLAIAGSRSVLVLHGVDLTVASAELESAGTTVAATAIHADAESETLTFDFPAGVAAGPATLHL